MQNNKQNNFRTALIIASLAGICFAPFASCADDKPKVAPVPLGYHTITPYLVVNDAGKALEFYKEAFGAQELEKHLTADGKRIAHAELKIGDSGLMISDAFSSEEVGSEKGWPTTKCSLFLYVPDVDKSFERAVKAGCKVLSPLSNQFWGDRFGSVMDPFGQEWSIASHIENVSREEMEKRAKEYFMKMKEATDSAIRATDSAKKNK